MTLEQAKQLTEFYDKCRRVVDSPDINWETKYDFVFNKENPRIPFQWYDPDTSEEEDVMAFMSAFEENIVNYRGLVKALES